MLIETQMYKVILAKIADSYSSNVEVHFDNFILDMNDLLANLELNTPILSSYQNKLRFINFNTFSIIRNGMLKGECIKFEYNSEYNLYELYMLQKVFNDNISEYAQRLADIIK